MTTMMIVATLGMAKDCVGCDDYDSADSGDEACACGAEGGDDCTTHACDDVACGGSAGSDYGVAADGGD